MKIFYHSRDLDGICSGAILKQKYPDAEMIGYDYGEDYPDMEGEDVVFVDVSLPAEGMRQVANKNRLVWIDHHKFIIDVYNKDPWPCEAVLEVGVAACELTWSYCFPDREMPAVVTLLGRYDTFRRQEGFWDFTLAFQYGMRARCNSLKTFPIHLFKDPSELPAPPGRKPPSSKKLCEPFAYDGQMILRYLDSANEEMCRRFAFETEFEGYRVIAMNTNQFNTQAFKSIEGDYDIMIPFAYTKHFWTVSLYTEKDIDCSILAAKYGGGGHAKAAGFQIEDIREIFDI